MGAIKLLAVAIGLLVPGVHPHYRFQQLIVNNNKEDKLQYVRPNSNLNFPVINQASDDLRCNVGCHNGTNTTTAAVEAGAKVIWNADVQVYHQGPVFVYMTKVDNVMTADGSTKWFKIMEIGPSFSPKGGDWEATMQGKF
ncbi:hypothetical protein FKW77_005758 [Venturia effusa]|uniref:AA9 family lytic polysaccharide monooxygenase n=1 Tax=Venturia effusa TaxID=50376 RepID=A0A517LHG0_9PEZI|nr:hypothetical protein FKW77_005758 [Venturia effusa]